jgi:uncharacterized membrane protein YdbT with pleckstrin-like domain
MVQDDERVIRPPFEQITSGRVFRPTNAFIGKKIIKISIILLLVWGLIWLLFQGLNDPIVGEILRAGWQPLELVSEVGWEITNLVYMVFMIVAFLTGTVYETIYVKRIEYSVLGWTGDSMPEIYTKRGIITITKRHVPFRTVTNVQTRRGVFDRIMGIGTVLIETAGGAVSAQPTGLLPLLIQKIGGSNNSEERVEGIRFHEELRDFILREMREIGKSPSKQEQTTHQRGSKRIFTRQTLEAFKEVRDALKASQETVGGD